MDHVEGTNAAYIFQLLRKGQCLNPYNITYSEFKSILVEGYDDSNKFNNVEDATCRNIIEFNIRKAIREDKLDFRV